MKKIHRIILLLLMFFGISNMAKASGSAVQDAMRGNAKFNVVAVVLSVIFAGIVFFLFRLDRKISKLEKNKDNNK